MTKKEKENLTLVERLEYDIAFDEKNRMPLDRIDWKHEHGVAVTVNEAKLFLELLQRSEIYIVIRTDRMGEDAIELVFQNLEDAEKYAALENNKSRWPDEQYLVCTFKMN
jgi:hypothetical protein